MKLSLDIKNFGKLKQAQIEVNNLTILAGKNNSGKTFVSKALYSFFKSIHTIDLWMDLFEKINQIITLIDRLSLLIPYSSEKDKEFTSLMTVNLVRIENEIRKNNNLSLRMEIDNISYLKNDIENLKMRLSSYKEKLTTKERKYTDPVKHVIDQLGAEINALTAFLEKPKNLLETQLKTKFKSQLKRNFQVPALNYFINNEGSNKTKFNISSLGEIEISDKDNIVFSLAIVTLNEIKNFSQVIYLDSPIYLKLKPALENLLIQLQQRDKHLIGVPQHFYDLISLLNLKTMEEPKFKERSEEIESTIGGQLKLSADGSFVFQDKKASYPINTTALGVANLGMIGLLLKQNLIDENSFLFIDEPEAHLHPAWQVVLIQVLYQLAKAGVNVMLATHSNDIIKYLEVISKKDEQAQSLIALNCLTIEGNTIHEKDDFMTKLNVIQQELSDPFFKLYMETL